MIRPLLPASVAEAISTVVAPAGSVIPSCLANFTGIRWILPAR